MLKRYKNAKQVVVKEIHVENRFANRRPNAENPETTANLVATANPGVKWIHTYMSYCFNTFMGYDM